MTLFYIKKRELAHAFSRFFFDCHKTASLFLLNRFNYYIATIGQCFVYDNIIFNIN